MPLLLMEIEAAVADPAPWIEGDNAPLLFALVLLGHCRVLEAHDTLLRLAALPDDGTEALLGDATNELLPVHLWQTSGGETAGLRWLLENREAGEFARIAAIQALVFGVLFGELDHASTCDYLAGLLDDKTLAPADETLWPCLVHGLIDLYPDAHERAARRFPESIHGYLAHWAGFQSLADRDAGGMAIPLGDSGSPGADGGGGASSADPRKKKKKRKEQKKARKANRGKR